MSLPTTLMTQETIVRLKILSVDLTPEMITQAVGLSSDHGWHVGDLRKHTIIKEKNNGWVVDSGLPRSASLQDHVSALLSLLDMKAEPLRLLLGTAQIEFSCVIYSDSLPALNFDSSVINELGRIGAGLDIDLYVLDEESDG